MRGLFLPPDINAMLHVAEQKARIADKGRTGIDLPRGINMNPGSVHRMTVRESVIRAMRKTCSLLRLCDGNVLPGQSFKFPAKIKDTRHCMCNILRPCRGNSRAAPLSAQEVKAHAAHIAEIVCHLYDAREFPDIFRRNNTGQTDLNAALCETPNPGDHVGRSAAPIGIAAERIVNRRPAVEADADADARTVQEVCCLIRNQRPIRLEIHARPYPIGANIVCSPAQQRKSQQRLAARELEDERSSALRCEVNRTACGLPRHRSLVLTGCIAVTARKIAVSRETQHQHPQRHRNLLYFTSAKRSG